MGKKIQPPPLTGTVEHKGGVNADAEIVLNSPVTKRHVEAYGQEKLIEAMRAAVEAARQAVRESIVSLGFVKSGGLLESVHAGLITESMGTVVFIGSHAESGRSYSQVAAHLDKQYGLLDYSDFLERSQAEWFRVLNG